ncbi:MAG: hypothetical protein IJM76_06115 [Lachnospiraceae bacterium]|nr:hypothetical protein [Lachnospiraceae bacterium]
MNRRQAKKAFKKKYGVSPEQMAETMRYAVSPEVLKRVTDMLVDLSHSLLEWAADFTQRVVKAFSEIAEKISRST